MHEGEVDAVERKLRLVEVEEPLPDAVEDGAEEVALRISRACVRERDFEATPPLGASEERQDAATTSFGQARATAATGSEGEQEDRQPVAPGDAERLEAEPGDADDALRRGRRGRYA